MEALVVIQGCLLQFSKEDPRRAIDKIEMISTHWQSRRLDAKHVPNSFRVIITMSEYSCP